MAKQHLVSRVLREHPGMNLCQFAQSDLAQLCAEKIRNLLPLEESLPLVAIYLWGSIVRTDFVRGRSDIDSVAIGEEIGLAELCRRVSLGVTEADAGLKKFKVRPLYLEDLNSECPRSELAQIVHPKILLADFSNWHLVYGHRYSLEDFVIAPGSLDEILELRLAALSRRLRTHNLEPTREPARYIIKELAFICHVLHQKRVGVHCFSFSALTRFSDLTTREVVEIVTYLHDSGWGEEDCERALRVAARFLSRVV